MRGYSRPRKTRFDSVDNRMPLKSSSSKTSGIASRIVLLCRGSLGLNGLVGTRRLFRLFVRSDL